MPTGALLYNEAFRPFDGPNAPDAKLSKGDHAEVLPNLSGYSPHLTARSVLDILLVSFLIYQFLLLVRGTRAVPMLTGVGALVIAFYIAHLSNLRTLDWLVGTILPYSIFALIVIFQTEIRQALARLGRNLTLARGSQNGTADAYDDIVMAATTFSQDQTGALVVIEREIGLRTYIESGVPLDAHLSYELLATLFRPSAPLHDGAVILQKDRVAAAACFLPLSMNPLLSTQLGTRHRAGIGITEETDAVSVIVSEETGAISIAVAGQVEREITPERLRQRLGELLMRYPGSPRTRIRRRTSRPVLPKSAAARVRKTARFIRKNVVPSTGETSCDHPTPPSYLRPRAAQTDIADHRDPHVVRSGARSGRGGFPSRADRVLPPAEGSGLHLGRHSASATPPSWTGPCAARSRRRKRARRRRPPGRDPWRTHL